MSDIFLIIIICLIILIIIILLIILLPHQHQDIPLNLNDDRKIYVSIASYRDSQCPITLYQLFSKASNPNNIYVMICCQNSSDDTDPLDYSQLNLSPEQNTLYQEWIQDHVSIFDMKHTDARGPVLARYHCSRMILDLLELEFNKKQSFFLQIDSHMRCLDKWDLLIKGMYDECVFQNNHNKIILSQYPMEYDVANDKISDNYKTKTSHACYGNFDSNNMLIPTSTLISIPDNYREVSVAAAGVLFADVELLRDVPYDSSLDYLFMGEELLYSVRAWCQNYKIYTPRMNVFFHFYERSNHPKIWVDDPQYYTINKKTTDKVKSVLLLNEVNKNYENNNLYPSSDQVKEYYKYFQIDYINKKVKNLC